MKIATRAEVKHCQHIRPTFDWTENREGFIPEIVFTGFPARGVMQLSKSTVIVVCSRCVLDPLKNSDHVHMS